MAQLQIGRAGLVDSLTIAGPQDWRVSGSRHRINGVLKSTSLANTKALRDLLLHQVNEVVPVTYDVDDSFDGFYRVLDADVDARHRLGSLQGNGLFAFDVDLELIGTASSAQWQALAHNPLKTNDHGLTDAEVNWWFGFPIGSFDWDLKDTAGSTGEITRATEEGDITVGVGMPDTSPQYRVSPANFYKGGCYVKVGGFEVAGTHVELDVTDWEFGNHAVKVTPGLTASASNGEIEVSHWDTAFTTAKAYQIKYATTTKIGKWTGFEIIKNTPQEVIVELTLDADEAGGNAFTRHTLRLGVRRGGLIVYGKFKYTGGATTWTVERVTAEAADAITPTGASSAMAVSATANDADGNRYIIGSSKSVTTELTQGGLDFASTTLFDFFLSSRIDGTSSQAQDTAENQCLQYLAVSNVQETPVPRR